MNLNTPPQPRFRHSSSSSSESYSPSTPTNARGVRRLAAPPGSALRDRGTPVGRLLASEGMTAPQSPRRKVRQRTWVEKAQEWPSNLIMSLETSIQMLSLDPAGYPLAIGLNIVHLLTRLPVFAAALPSWLRIGGGGATRSRYYASAAELADADARFEALRRQSSLSWGWTATVVSIVLVLISFANVAYLFSRRRTYQLVLRQDPLASPNARSATLDFSTSQRHLTLGERLKRKLSSLIWAPKPEDHHTFNIQQLDIWTPEYVQWSTRLFTLYPPPLALMYHFLKPSTFFPFVICGSLLVAQTWTLIYLYTHLVKDRALLQAEVQHEYNVKFVNPRIFVAKKDAATSTSEAEFVRADEWRTSGSGSARKSRRPRSEEQVFSGEEEEEDAAPREVVRGSGRKVRRGRESSVQMG